MRVKQMAAGIVAVAVAAFALYVVVRPDAAGRAGDDGTVGEERTPVLSETPEIPYTPEPTITPIDLGEALTEPVVIGLAGRLVTLPIGSTLTNVLLNCGEVGLDGEVADEDCTDSSRALHEIRLNEALLIVSGSGEVLRREGHDPALSEIERQLAQPALMPTVVPYDFEGGRTPEDAEATVAGRTVIVPRGWALLRWDYDGSGRVITEIRFGTSRIFVDEASGAVVMTDIQPADADAFAPLAALFEAR